MPSARTSVGNKEYEYEGKEKRAASLQQAGNRRETISLGDAVVAVALRHVIERTAVQMDLSIHFFCFAEICVGCHTFGRPDVQTKTALTVLEVCFTRNVTLQPVLFRDPEG